ncbi:hypothetical protein EAE96_010790 [Botrytis aclada]|nr:hypothetical protein EAE96_010790 [Botrytis aclada]
MDLDNHRNLVSLSVNGCLKSWQMSGFTLTRSIPFESSGHAGDSFGAQGFPCLAVTSKVGIVSFNPFSNRVAQTPRLRKSFSGTLSMKKHYGIQLRKIGPVSTSTSTVGG